MVDFHAHILPCADHGSDGIETSLYQVRTAMEADVDTIIATPHFYMNSDNIADFIDRREKSYNELIHAMNEAKINVNIVKGCEVNLQVDLFEIDDLKPLCIDGTNFMLLEMPMNVGWTQWHYDAVDEIISRGIEPIIAHINRYSDQALQKLFDKDIMYQINIESLDNFSSRYRMKRFFKNGYVHFIGSDIHGTSEAYKVMKKYSEKYTKLFNSCNLNALSILNSRKMR